MLRIMDPSFYTYTYRRRRRLARRSTGADQKLGTAAFFLTGWYRTVRYICTVFCCTVLYTVVLYGTYSSTLVTHLLPPPLCPT